MPTVELLLRTSLATLALAGIAVSALLLYGAQSWWSPAIALLRAGLQLAALSLVLTGIVSNPIWVGVALIVMLVVASVVAAHRSGELLTAWWRSALSLTTGAAVAGGVVFATGAVDPAPRYVLAVGAMVIGNAMTVASLSSHRIRQLRRDRWSEVEAWLSLGATPRRATVELNRAAVHDAMIPSVDQTKTTGVVVLPGAFVGALFGGLSPVEAGRFQLVVLAAILAAGAITAVTTVFLASGNRVLAPR